MEVLEAIKARHSVRSYTDKKIDKDTKDILLNLIEDCNKKGDMNIQLFTEEPKVFNSFMAKYGKFRNVKNYIAIIGKKGSDLQEKAGYYGEKIVLKAMQMGLNTCWVALSYGKRKGEFIINEDEKLCCVISLGYGENQGIKRKTKSIEELSKVEVEIPNWFRKGMEAVQLAPTAMNQQKFIIKLEGNTVTAKPLMGVYTKLDIGIIKYHFEIGAEGANWKWGK